MERDEFKILVKAMKAVYADPKFIADKDAFNVWLTLLNDISYEQAHMAIQRYMMTNKFPPTIADIREKVMECIHPEVQEMSELEAWSLVRKGIGNSIYNAEEEFNKLPEACKKAVGTPAMMREWATMDSDELGTVEQSHFIRNYRVAIERMKTDAKLPIDFRNRLEEIRSQALLTVAPAM